MKGPVGALVLPAGARAHPLSLEEVRALRTLANRMTAQLGVSGALARARDARGRSSPLGRTSRPTRAAALEKGVMTATRRHESNARRFARPALGRPLQPRGSHHHGAARARRPEHRTPLILLTPPGIDPDSLCGGRARRRARAARARSSWWTAPASTSSKRRAGAIPSARRSTSRNGGSLLVLSIAALLARGSAVSRDGAIGGRAARRTVKRQSTWRSWSSVPDRRSAQLVETGELDHALARGASASA